MESAMARLLQRKKVLPSPIRGEIVQIGAVRMSCEGTVADEFQTLIRPAYYKK